MDSLTAALAGRRSWCLELLERLVHVNSFTGNREGGRRVAGMLATELSSVTGVTAHLVDSDRFAPHVVAHNARWSDTATASGGIGLVGHLDTVFPLGTFEGFRLDGPIARGPGVLDMKGGLCVMLAAMHALAQTGLLERVPLRVVIVSDEEVGSPEGRTVIERELRGAGAALVFEAGRAKDAVITSRKGTGAATVVATGRAAHAGNAHRDGANAIWALSRFVERAQSLTDYDRGMTVNVGRIEGGTSKNTVPDRAEALLDFRFVLVKDGQALVSSLREAAREAAASVPGTALSVEGGIARLPLERTDANVALYREYAACAKLAGLGDGEAGLTGGGSDASSTAAIGIPSIDGLGPRGTGFHTRDELVEVDTILPKAEALARFLAGRATVQTP